MIPVPVGIFVVVVLVALAAPSCAQRSRIDDIIDQGWMNAKARMEREGIRPSQNALPAGAFEPRSHHSHTHTATCGHDTLQAFHNITEISENIRKSGRRPQHSAASLKRDAAAIFGSLRIVNETSRMLAGSDSGYACYTAGASITPMWNPTGSYICQADDILSDGNRTAILTGVLPTAINVIASLLLVERKSDTLFLDGVYYDANGGQPCSLGIPIDTKLVFGKVGATGVPNADFYVYVTARPAQSSSNLASASSCNSIVTRTSPSTLYGRPLAGHINFNPFALTKIDLTDEFQFRRYVRVAVHEFFHSLGFSDQWYKHYVDDNGIPYDAINGPIKQITYPLSDGRVVTLLTTPRVQLFARKHYNCSDLEGFELEEGGGSGTAGSHWEMRISQNELMSGIADLKPIITNLTLSLFRDTGWYEVNWSMAEPFVFGYRAGCTFARNKCTSWDTMNIPATFCKELFSTQSIMCNFDRSAVSYCDLEPDVPNIPTKYQYFAGSPTYGSRNPLKDYCPTWTGFNNGYCESSNYFKRRAQEQSGMSFPSGGTSRCFDLGAGGAGTVGCFVHRCSNGFPEVLIAGTWTACPKGTSVPYTGASFSINCDFELCVSFSADSADYTTAPAPPSGGTLVPTGAADPVGAPGAYLYFWTNDLLQFGLVIGAVVLGAIIIIALIAVCVRRKK